MTTGPGGIDTDRARFMRHLLLAVVAASSWGAWSLFLRPSGIPATLTGPIVLLTMGVVLLPFKGSDGVTPRWDRTTWLLLLGMSLSDIVNVAAYFAAIERTTLGVAVLSHYLTPLMVALAAPFIDGERVKGARLAALVGTAGLALVLEPWRGGEAAKLEGAVLGAVSAVGYAANVFIMTRLAPRIGAARAVGYHAFISAVMLLPLASREDVATMTLRGVALVVVGGVTLGALSGWAFSRALPVIGPTLASTVAFLEPLVAVVVGLLFFDERLSALALVGAALIIGPGVYVARARSRAD